jgi:hypothetical protein
MNSKNTKGANKPKGRMSNYTFFVQMCREEHRKKHPNENVNFTEFSKKCAERWKVTTFLALFKKILNEFFPNKIQIFTFILFFKNSK